ncbi:MAG: sulfatase [Gemmatimonadetes bacterium]|nr:sulfatase [Gemmatimonadota bacterium]
MIRRNVIGGAFVGVVVMLAFWGLEWGHYGNRHFSWALEPGFLRIHLGLTAYGMLLYTIAGVVLGAAAGLVLHALLPFLPFLRGRVASFLLPAAFLAPVCFHLLRFINKKYLPKLLSLTSIAGNAAFGIGSLALFLFLSFTLDSWRRGDSRLAARMAGGVLGLAATLSIVAVVFWQATKPAFGDAWEGNGNPPNVVLFLIETTRADHLSCYGYERETSPRIDEIAAEGVLFETFYVAAPFSGPSKATLHTGLWPHNNGVRGMPQRILPEAKTMAEFFRSQGYETAGYASGFFMGPEYNYHKGCRTYEALGRPYDSFRFATALRGLELRLHKLTPWYLPEQERYELVNATHGVPRALDWIDATGGAPFFCLFELNEPHTIYEPIPPFETMFAPKKTDYTLMEDSRRNLAPRYEVVYNYPETGYTEEDLEYSIALYDGEIAWIDDAIGRFCDALEERGILDNTIIVVTSDHGENFGEHGTWFEHTQLYEQSLRVPMVIRYPAKLPAGKRVESPVQAVDVFPTLVELAGYEYDGPLDGVSLVRKVENDIPDYPVFAEDNILRDPALLDYENYRVYLPGVAGKWRMVRDGDYKLIYIPNPAGDEYELFNVAQDPMETTNLVREEPEVFARLKETLHAWIATDERGDQDVDAGMIEGMRDQLRALGYLQ